MTDIIGVMTQAAMEDSSAIYPKQWITAALKAAKAEGWELCRLPEQENFEGYSPPEDGNADYYWESGFEGCLDKIQRLELEP